jgi:IclR family transcriptional regulator, pca regulon regulatory protein
MKTFVVPQMIGLDVMACVEVRCNLPWSVASKVRRAAFAHNLSPGGLRGYRAICAGSDRSRGKSVGTKSPGKEDVVGGLGKGLRVLEAFDDTQPQHTATSVANRAGITRTAARRYLLSLVHFGYAASDGKQFWLTPRVLRLGQSYLSTAKLPRLVQPVLQQVATMCGHTVNASTLDDHEIVYIASSSPPHWVRIGYPVGARVPAHVVTPGVAVLSTFDDAALDKWIAEHEFAAFTAATVTGPKQFRAEVKQARAAGYWCTEGRLDPDLQGIAVPLLDRRGKCRGALSITLPKSAYPSADVMTARLLPLLRDAASGLRAIT